MIGSQPLVAVRERVRLALSASWLLKVRKLKEYGDSITNVFTGDPASWYIWSRPVDLAVTSLNSSIDELTWLNQCHEQDDDHLDCVLKEQVSYPSRLLHITQDSLKLVDVEPLLKKNMQD